MIGIISEQNNLNEYVAEVLAPVGMRIIRPMVRALCFCFSRCLQVEVALAPPPATHLPFPQLIARLQGVSLTSAADYRWMF